MAEQNQLFLSPILSPERTYQTLIATEGLWDQVKQNCRGLSNSITVFA